MNKRIYLSSPHLCGKEQKFVQDAFDSNWIAPLGPHVDAFEREMAEYLGIEYAVALSTGTAALHLALMLAEVKEGDTVEVGALLGEVNEGKPGSKKGRAIKSAARCNDKFRISYMVLAH